MLGQVAYFWGDVGQAEEHSFLARLTEEGMLVGCSCVRPVAASFLSRVLTAQLELRLFWGGEGRTQGPSFHIQRRGTHRTAPGRHNGTCETSGHPTGASVSDTTRSTWTPWATGAVPLESPRQARAPWRDLSMEGSQWQGQRVSAADSGL